VAEGAAELALEIGGGQVAACGVRGARIRGGRRAPPAAAREDGCGEEEQRGRAKRAQVLQETFTYQCFLWLVATIS
jgi:hypothetical protein